MQTDILFTPVRLGAVVAPHRILMAPLTRTRATREHVPTDLMVEHYTQRAGAGLIIAEATMVDPTASAFWSEPGIYSREQVAGWKRVTDAVHAAHGRIFLQLWHAGRATHPLVNGGFEPVGPSPLPIRGEIHTPAGKKDHPVPYVLRDDEIPGIVNLFRLGAINARAAGFDGVEVHGANGYLLDEFLRDGSNRRQGRYGGSVENRARLLLEVTEAVIGAWSADRVGVRLSPINSYNDMCDSDPVGTFGRVAELLDPLGLAYLHVLEHDIEGRQTEVVLPTIREKFHGPLIGNVGHSRESAAEAILDGQLDAVAFGRPYIANPDLARRFRLGAPLNEMDPDTLYGHGAEGYTDYPTLPSTLAVA